MQMKTIIGTTTSVIASVLKGKGLMLKSNSPPKAKINVTSG